MILEQRNPAASTSTSSSMDVSKMVQLEILRGEMQLRVEPPQKTMETFRPSAQIEQSATSKQDPLTLLQTQLNQQLDEQDHWEKLSTKLTKKSKQEADNVVRLATSLKVFRDEVTKHTNYVATLEEQLQDMKAKGDAQLKTMQEDQQQQLDRASHALKTAQESEDAYQDKMADKKPMDDRLQRMRKELAIANTRVQDLQVNVNSDVVTGNQKEYLKAELRIEQDHRDKLLRQVQHLSSQVDGLAKECKLFQDKAGLFRDEHRRRTMCAQEVAARIPIRLEALREQSAELWKKVEKAKEECSEWRDKTEKMARDLQDKQIEAQKLKVKAQLFHKQYETVQTNVQRLQARILAFQDESEAALNVDLSDEDEEDDGNDNTAKIAQPTQPSKSPCVWQRSLQAENKSVNKSIASKSVYEKATVLKPTVNHSVVQTTEISKPVAAKPVVFEKTQPKKDSDAIKPSHQMMPSYKAPEIASTPVVRVNHVKVKMDSPVVKAPVSQSVPNNESSELQTKLQALQQELDHQKRFQKEHALKMEHQMNQLASKVERLIAASANNNSSSIQVGGSFGHVAANNSNQMEELQKKMQENAQKDTQDVRQLLLQLNQQCQQWSSQLSQLQGALQQRDAKHLQLEQLLHSKETQYYEQMEFLRSEMQRQNQQQQTVMADKMNDMMVQFQRMLVEQQRRASSISSRGGDSMASLESLYPLDSPSKTTQVRFVEVPEVDRDTATLYAPLAGERPQQGLSMASGILSNTPIFQSMSAALGKSQQ